MFIRKHHMNYKLTKKGAVRIMRQLLSSSAVSDYFIVKYVKWFRNNLP